MGDLPIAKPLHTHENSAIFGHTTDIHSSQQPSIGPSLHHMNIVHTFTYCFFTIEYSSLIHVEISRVKLEKLKIVNEIFKLKFPVISLRFSLVYNC